MKDELTDFSRLEAMKKHPVSSQIDDVFRAVIKEKKPMEKKDLKLSVPDALPSLPTEVALGDSEFELSLSEEVSENKQQPQASDVFELSLDSGVDLELGGEALGEDGVSDSDYGEVSLEEDYGKQDNSDELSLGSGSAEESIENLGELSFDDQSIDLSFSGAEKSDEGGLSLDEIDLSGEDGIPSLEQTSDKLRLGETDLQDADFGASDLQGESLLDVESIEFGADDVAPLSDLNQNELSEDAKKKLMEIDQIMVMDASKINIANSLPEKNLDEPLVSEDLDLGNLNFSGDEQEAAPVKEEKPKKKKKEPETKDLPREVGQELREISGAYTVEMERLQATLSNLRVDRQELLSKIQKLEEDKILQSRSMLTLQAELDEKKIEMTIIRKKLNEEIIELKDRLRVQEERRLILEEKNRFLTLEVEKSSQKSKIDVKKVQLRERELEQKLELLKADAETQIRYRDQKILELKRKIDAMEFDMESISQQEKRSVESRFELEDKLEKAIKTLRSAINVLEDEPERVDALKALKKNIDM